MSMVKIEIQREHNNCERERGRDSYGILLYTHNNDLLQQKTIILIIRWSGPE